MTENKPWGLAEYHEQNQVPRTGHLCPRVCWCGATLNPFRSRSFFVFETKKRVLETKPQRWVKVLVVSSEPLQFEVAIGEEWLPLNQLVFHTKLKEGGWSLLSSGCLVCFCLFSLSNGLFITQRSLLLHQWIGFARKHLSEAIWATNFFDKIIDGYKDLVVEHKAYSW